MKSIRIIKQGILFIVFLSACKNKYTSKDTIAHWGKFENNKTLKYELVDITKTPVFNKISEGGILKPEYAYLNKVNIYSCVHYSDSMYITGLIVSPKVTQKKFPCIIYNRGGNRELGSLIVATAVEYMAALAAQGYVVAATNYRGSPGCEGNDEFGGKDVNDVLNLMNSLSEFPEADTSKIGMFGVSRGGMMCFLAHTKSNRIKAIATIGAMTDLIAIKQFRPEFENEVYKELIPNYNTDKNNLLKQRSAYYLADGFNLETPILLMHGKADDKVPCEQSIKMANRLKELSFEHKLKIYENDDHGLNQNKAIAFDEVLNWFNTYLK